MSVFKMCHQTCDFGVVIILNNTHVQAYVYGYYNLGRGKIWPLKGNTGRLGCWQGALLRYLFSHCSQSLSSLDGQDEDTEDEDEDEDSSVSDRSGASYQERSKSPVAMARRGERILYMWLVVDSCGYFVNSTLP